MLNISVWCTKADRLSTKIGGGQTLQKNGGQVYTFSNSIGMELLR